MNSLHDHGHKRTSINELLNPVAPSGQYDPQSAYPANQLPSLAPQTAYMPASHQQHVSAPPAYPSQIHTPGSSFSLRAASWDHGAQDALSARRQDVDSAASCRYGPQAVSSHSGYPDQYPRASRSVDEPPNYGMEVWANAHDSPNVPFNGPVIAQGYPDERSGISNDAMHKSYPIPPSGSFEPELISQPYPPGSYYPVMMANSNSARRNLPNQHPGLQHPAAAILQAPYPNQGFYPTHVAFAAIPVVAAPPPSKRPLEHEDDTSNSKAKRSKIKGKSASESNASTSRRGYNAKKRSEAAQIAAQSAMVPTMLTYMPMPADKGKERVVQGSALRIVGEDSVPRPEGSTQFHPELQFARCMSNRYRSEEFPRCVSCTRRWAGDTCRFQGIRFFLKNEKRDIVGISFIETQKADGPSMNFPLSWNVPLKNHHLRRVKRTVARALLPVLKKEMEHLAKPEVIRRPRESEVRATCDTCMTSIFSCSWMCRLCGREACAECFEQVKELTIDRVGADEAEIAALQARREKHAHINPFFLSCTRRNEHRATDFSPMSRFSKDELSQTIRDMDELLAEPDEDSLVPASRTPPPSSSNGEASNGFANPDPHSSNGNSSPPSHTDYDSTTISTPTTSTFAASPTISEVDKPVPGSSALPSHPTRSFTDQELTDDVFRRVWSIGEPLVVTGLAPKFKVQWTPEYFKAKYGTQGCLILECQTDKNNRVSVGEFFSWFGKYEGRVDCWKLKDWPPSTDFKTAFPELYDDFSQATPVPNYVRRDGVLNIASHFPSNTVAPDLGPKMYNAMASFESQGSKGSTRLHMDMADAVNIMLYASHTPDGRPGSAAWDLFRAEDSAKLRKFLRKKFKGTYQHDPIHSQQFYLDSQLRQELLDSYGVKSHRIYQKPGDAVFIPAGCAHQVCNLADCIKVACDFVSPENVDRCETLTREFREQNQSMAWKEDVLQLRTMMWFAWLSCCRQEKEMNS